MCTGLKGIRTHLSTTNFLIAAAVRAGWALTAQRMAPPPGWAARPACASSTRTAASPSKASAKGTPRAPAGGPEGPAAASACGRAAR
eukprot:5334184-Prymnesium_polylepis.1